MLSDHKIALDVPFIVEPLDFLLGPLICHVFDVSVSIKHLLSRYNN